VTQPDDTASSQVLYIVSCAAPPALDVHIFIELAQQDGWEVCLIATPRAFQWIDVPGLSEQTGHPVRYDYKLPGEPDVLPEPDAIVVAPATFNTLNKWAAGSPTPWRLGCCVRRLGRAWLLWSCHT
jgi:phosphopantothenoylcysteine decarboxylase